MIKKRSKILVALLALIFVVSLIPIQFALAKEPADSDVSDTSQTEGEGTETPEQQDEEKSETAPAIQEKSPAKNAENSIEEQLRALADGETLSIHLTEDYATSGNVVNVTANNATVIFTVEESVVIHNEQLPFIDIKGSGNHIDFGGVTLRSAPLIISGSNNTVTHFDAYGNNRSAVTVTGDGNTVARAEIKGNIADKGAGILILNGGLTLHDVFISGNNAPQGAGLFVDGGQLHLKSEVQIIGNEARDTKDADATGGGVALVNAAHMQITDAIIRNNNAQVTNWQNQKFGKGGGIYVDESATLSIDSASFYNNDADHGAGIYYGGNTAPIHLGEEVRLRNNTARRFGGGLFVGEGNKVVVDGTTIAYNTANQGTQSGDTGYGGGIYLDKNTTLDVYNATLSENHADMGGIYGEDKSVITLHSGAVNDNTTYGGGAGIGGAFAVHYPNNVAAIAETSYITINGGTVDGNLAMQQDPNRPTFNIGGALSGYHITINGGSVSQNRAVHGFAGAGYSYELFVHGGTVDGNVVERSNGIGTYIAGGGFYTTNFTMTDGAITNNRYLSKETKYGTKYIYGGGVYVYADNDAYATSHINMSGGTISGNVAENGGGLAQLNYGSPYIPAYDQKTILTGGEISNNTGTASGGGAWFNAGDVTIAGDTLFKNNTTDGDGGAIEKIGGVLTLKDSASFVDNTSQGDGGAIDSWNGVANGQVSITVTDSVLFSGNTGKNGGALAVGNYVVGSPTAIDVDGAVRFEGNTATRDGGAIYTLAAFTNASGGTAYTNNISDITVGKRVIFEDNAAASGWLMTSAADIEQHKDLVKTNTFTKPFEYAYSNYDIVYKQGDEYVPPVIVTVKYDYNYNNKGTYYTQEVEDNTLLVAPKEPTRAQYRFTGWFKDAGANDKWDFNKDTITTDLTLYAGWEKVITPQPEIPTEPQKPTPPTVNPPVIVTPPTTPEQPTPPVDPTPEEEVTETTPAAPKPTTETPKKTVSKESDVADISAPNSPVFSIGDNMVPLFGKTGNVWALLNLLLTIAGALLAAVWMASYLLSGKRSSEHDGEESDDTGTDKKKGGLMWRVLAAITALFSIVVFVLTENISLPMAIMDKWTILMAVLFALVVLFGLLMRKNKEEQEPIEEFEA